MKTRPWVDVADLRVPHDPEAENAVQAASSILFALSGQRFGGVFSTTEQYTCHSSGAPVGCSYDSEVGGYWNPAVGAYTYVLGRPPGPRRMAPGGSIRLRGRPVRRIVELSINGAVIEPTEYRLYNRAILVPNAHVSWGLCSSPLVRYEYGSEPPAMGRMAARKLADELVEAFNGRECGLPANVTSASRQGLSFQIFDPQDFLEKGRIGIYEVDLFLTAFNPSKAHKRARVFSPDIPRAYGLT